MSTAFTLKTQKATNQFYEEILPSDVRLRMMQIPAGEFLMRSPETERENPKEEQPQHLVMVSSFFLGKYPITQAQWQAVATLTEIARHLDPKPSHFEGDSLPVEQVSWYEAEEFCARLSQHTQRQYRLPTEAEWEYACRARTNTPFHFGETISPKVANYQSKTAYAGGPTGQPLNTTTPKDHFKVANAWGLCDMHGNVWEWCQDHWNDHYNGAPPDGSAWLNEYDDLRRVLRGGFWAGQPIFCRSAHRKWTYKDLRDDFNGFRVACSAPGVTVS